MKSKILLVIIFSFFPFLTELRGQDPHGPDKTHSSASQTGVEPEKHAGGEGEKHDHHHEGGHSSADREEPIEDLLRETCEHKILMVDCDECRYEIGSVKVATSSASLMKVESLQSTPEENFIEVNGELSFDENHLRCITSRFPGRIASISARIGDLVKESQPVLMVESSELAQSAIDLLKRHSEFDLANRKLEREIMLRGKKISSEQELQEAQATMDLARIELDNAKRKLTMFGFSGSRITTLPKKHHDPIFRGEMLIQSPLTGRVTFRDGNIGDMIPGEKEILKIVDLRHLWGVAQIHEKDMAIVLNALKLGEIKAEIKVEAIPDSSYSGKVFGADPKIAVETRTLPVRLQIENHDETLRPGMFFKARLFLGDPKKLPTIASKAVMEDSGREFVFVKYGDSLYFRRNVITGPRVGDRTIVIKGIKAGDEVVTDGAFLLKSDILREKMGAGCAD